MMPDIRKAFERCQRRYPTIDLPFEDYAARVRQCLVESSSPQLHHEDLFLATACARGDRTAWEFFADEYMQQLQRMARQACRNMAEGEDLSQEIIQSMLDERHKLSSYSGRGSLVAWLRVTVSRAALDRFRRRRREVSLDDGADGPMPQHGPVAPQHPAADEALDSRWGPVLSQAVLEEIRRLPARDRLLLSLYYLRSVTLKDIAAQFQVHESTASRWLEGLRTGMKRRIERHLKSRYGLKPREIEALWQFAAQGTGLRIREALRLR